MPQSEIGNVPSFFRGTLAAMMGSPSKAISYLPSNSDTNSIKTRLQNVLLEMELAKNTLDQMPPARPEGESMPYGSSPLYLDILNNISEEKRDENQKLETQWIYSVLDGGVPTGFHEYSTAKYNYETNKKIAELLASAGSAKELLVNDTQLLSQFFNNQKYIQTTLVKWENYLDDKLKENDLLYNKLNDILETQRRESVFTITDIRTLSKWKKIAEYAFILILIILVLYFIIQHYTDLKNFADITKKTLEKHTK